MPRKPTRRSKNQKRRTRRNKLRFRGGGGDEYK